MIPHKFKVDGARRPLLVGVAIGLVVVAVGWFLPWKHFLNLSLLAVGFAAVLWRPVS